LTVPVTSGFSTVSFAIPTGAVSSFKITGGNTRYWYMDDLAFGNSSTTSAITNGGSTQQTPPTISGTLSAALAANEVVEVFRNGVSIGNATVSGTSWSKADSTLSAVQTDVYTSRVKNTVTGLYLNTSNVWTINPVPELLSITDNNANAVVANGTAVTYTFNFSQAVTGFDASDVTVINGTKGAFTAVSSTQYTLVVTEPASGSGTTQVFVADGSYNALVDSVAGLSGTGGSALQDYGPATVAAATAKTVNGTTAADTLYGSDAADTLSAVGGGGGTGSADKVYAGAGNDTVTLDADNITQLATSGSGALVDGGAGTNILKLSGSGLTLDLTLATVSTNLKNFSSVDLTGSGNNTLKLNLEDVLSLSGAVDNATSTGADESKMLVVNGDAGDVVQLVSGSQWTQAGSGLAGATLGGTVAANAYGSSFGFVTGDTYAKYTYGGATLFIDETLLVTNL
jgi:hypothetical protein